MPTPLDQSVARPLSCSMTDKATKSRILTTFWRSDTVHYRQSHLEFQEAYLAFYSAKCYSAYHKDQAAGGHAVNTHQDLLSGADIIIPHVDKSKAELRSILRSELTFLQDATDAALNNTIHLIISLFTMADIQGNQVVPNSQSLIWENDDQACPRELSVRFITKKAFPTTLNLMNLERLAGFTISWTSNIVEHLSIQITENRKRLLVYHHITHLVNCKAGVYTETLRQEIKLSLALLLPARTNTAIKNWFDTQAQLALKEPKLLDPAAADCTLRKTTIVYLDDFTHLRERLEALMQFYEESEPQTLSQWWFDRRKRVQWATFWTAILVFVFTMVFGMVQSVASVVQAWASIKALNRI